MYCSTDKVRTQLYQQVGVVQTHDPPLASQWMVDICGASVMHEPGDESSSY